MKSFRQFCCGLLSGHAYGERERVPVLTDEGSTFAFKRSCCRCGRAELEPYSFEVCISVTEADLARAGDRQRFIEPITAALTRALEVYPSPLPHGFAISATFWGASLVRGAEEYVGFFPASARHSALRLMMGHNVQPFAFVVQFSERHSTADLEL